MELTPRLRLMNWLVSQGLTGLPENDLIRGFCERCCDGGVPLSYGLVVIDTLHPIFEGRGFRWHDTQSNQPQSFEYGPTEEGDAAEGWKRSIFYDMLEQGDEHRVVDLTDESAFRYSRFDELAAQGHKHVTSFVHRFGEAGTMGQMDCVYSNWTTRRDDGFGEEGLAAMRDLVPVLGLAIKSAAQADIARTLGRVYLGRETAEQVLRGKMSRGITEKIKAVLWFSDLRSFTTITDTAKPTEIIPLLNDYAEAVITAIHEAGGDVLKLIGDGTLALFRADDPAEACRRALKADRIVRARVRELNEKRKAEERPVTSVYVGLHVGEVFYGNIGSIERLDFTVVGPAVNEASRIASMCRSVDRQVLISSNFAEALPAGERSNLVSVGRFALRGVGHAKELFTLDPATL